MRYLPLILLGFSACTVTRPSPDLVEPTVRHENLNAVLWMQTAVEYRATTLGIYRGAEALLPGLLQDTTVSADLVQRARGGFGSLPPAIILDADETVIDNSRYQARLLLDDEPYSSATWNAWAREEQAGAIPGALAFTRTAAALGIKVFYVTNRTAEVENATRRNLERLGFPLEQNEDVILTRDERADWESDKATRRDHVADRYRVVMLVGDNLGDFISGENVSLARREEIVGPHEALWGRVWIMLPNPTYGSWEGALFDFDYSLSPEEQRQAKARMLDSGRE